MSDPITRPPDWIPKEREESLCPCKSRLSYAECCMPFHYGRTRPETAEQLMRSRYAAYFFRLVDYLVDTTHPSTREPTLKQELEKTIHEVNWSFLTIVDVSKGGKEDKTGKVEFVATYYLEDEPHELLAHQLAPAGPGPARSLATSSFASR